MPEDTSATGTTDTQPADAAATETSERTINQQAKDLPFVKQLIAEKAANDKEKAEREEAKTKAERDAAEKKLADEGKWDEAKELHTAEVDSLKASHAKDMLARDLKMELLSAGFKNPNWLKGSVADYNAETHGTPTEYAAALAKDEANAPFLATDTARTVHKGPNPANVTGGSAELTNSQVQVMEKSDDPKERQKARDYLKACRLDGRGYPK